MTLSTEMQGFTPPPTFSWLFLIPGIGLIVTGLAAVVLPVVTSLAADIMFGGLLTLGGLGYGIYAWNSPSRDARVGAMVWSFLYLVSGVTLLSDPWSGLVTLTLIVALLFILEGFVKVIIAIPYAPRHQRFWRIFDGLLAMVLGMLIWSHWPGDSSWIIGFMLGLRLLMAGFLLTTLALSLNVELETTTVQNK